MSIAVSDAAHEVDVVHRQTSPHYDILGDDVFYPVNHRQLRDLLGRLLTQLDAMALPDRAHRAAKTLLTQEVWRWWDSAADNATTSFEGCIAPIMVANGGRHVEGAKPSNRWGWESEAVWLAGNPAQSEPATE